MLSGTLSLPRTAYLRQFALARSMYMASTQTFRFFLGLLSISPNLSSASYYWLLRFPDSNAHRTDFWANTASKAELLAFSRGKLAETLEQFREVLEWQKEKDMLAPLAIRDMVPVVLPEGRVTLLGDAAHPMSNCE